MEAAHRARSLARRLALQALYQMQINPRSWQDTHRQFAEDPEAERVDREYFKEPDRRRSRRIGEALDAQLAKIVRDSPAELDPIEHAALWLGLHELAACPELPYRVVLAEAVELTKQIRRDRRPQVRQRGAGPRRKELRRRVRQPAEYGRA